MDTSSIYTKITSGRHLQNRKLNIKSWASARRFQFLRFNSSYTCETTLLNQSGTVWNTVELSITCRTSNSICMHANS
jgi:hypothetical protein